MKYFTYKKNIFAFFLLGAFFFSACFQAIYEDTPLDYIPPAVSDISVDFSAPTGSDMIIATIYGATFLEIISASQFSLYQGSIGIPLNVPQRDSDTRVIFSFDSGSGNGLGGSGYRLIVRKEALKGAASRMTAQPVKSGVWTSASGIDGIFSRSVIWDIGYGSGKFVAVADEGKMAYSDDGIDWTAIRPGYNSMQSQFNDTIRGIAWGDGQFVAVGYGARMASSDNGINWNGWTESMFSGQSILSITYGGGRFVAGSDNGKIIYKQDSGNWTGVHDSGFGDKSILALCWGNIGGNSLYVSAGQYGHIPISGDAVNWDGSIDSKFGAENNNIYGLACGNNCYVAVGDGGKISYSPNGWEWQLIAPVSGNNPFDSKSIQSVSFGSGIFVAAGIDGKMAKSSDGQNWTLINSGAAGNQFATGWLIQTVGYGGGKFAAAGHQYSQDGNSRIALGYQAPEIIAAPSDLVSDPFNIRAGDNRLIITLSSGKFADFVSLGNFTVIGSGGIAAGDLDGRGSIIERSEQRIVIRLNESAPTSGSGQRIETAAAAFALMPLRMTVQADKIYIWKIANSNPFADSTISAIAHNNVTGSGSRYVAVGGGKIALSNDGKEWRESPDKGKWANPDDFVLFHDVAYGNGRFVAVGYWVYGGDPGDINGEKYGWGVAAYSSDSGETWTINDKILTSSSEDFSPRVFTIAHNGLAGANSRFIAGGRWGRSAYSTDGSAWTPVLLAPFDYEDVLDIVYGDGKFVAVGTNGKTAWSGDNGSGWTWAANSLLGDFVDIKTICYGNDNFVAAGNDGKMKVVAKGDIATATGDNGGNLWQGVDSKFAYSGILSVAHNGSRFIAAGHNGRMSESADGINWMPISTGQGAGQNQFNSGEQINNIIWDGGKFIAGGNAYSDNGNNSKLIYGE